MVQDNVGKVLCADDIQPISLALLCEEPVGRDREEVDPRRRDASGTKTFALTWRPRSVVERESSDTTKTRFKR